LDVAIETGHLLRLAFGRPWRQTEGLSRSLAVGAALLVRPRRDQHPFPAPPPSKACRPVSSRPDPSLSGLGRGHRRRRCSLTTSTPSSPRPTEASTQQVDSAHRVPAARRGADRQEPRPQHSRRVGRAKPRRGRGPLPATCPSRSRAAQLRAGLDVPGPERDDRRFQALHAHTGTCRCHGGCGRGKTGVVVGCGRGCRRAAGCGGRCCRRLTRPQ